MYRLTLGVMLTAVGLAGCDSASPLSPGSRPVTISGYVYAQGSSDGEPMIDNAVIAVEDGGGSRAQAATRSDGFYALMVRPGRVSITASKDGFEAKALQVEVSADTILNFSLSPMAR